MKGDTKTAEKIIEGGKLGEAFGKVGHGGADFC